MLPLNIEVSNKPEKLKDSSQDNPDRKSNKSFGQNFSNRDSKSEGSRNDNANEPQTILSKLTSNPTILAIKKVSQEQAPTKQNLMLETFSSKELNHKLKSEPISNLWSTNKMNNWRIKLSKSDSFKEKKKEFNEF